MKSIHIFVPSHWGNNWYERLMGECLKPRLMDFSRVWSLRYVAPIGKDRLVMGNRLPSGYIRHGQYRFANIRVEAANPLARAFMQENAVALRCWASHGGWVDYDYSHDLETARFKGLDAERIGVLMDALTRLYIDSLTYSKRLGWHVAPNIHDENPVTHTSFDSIYHLVSNALAQPAEVIVTPKGRLGTRWMNLDEFPRLKKSKKPYPLRLHY